MRGRPSMQRLHFGGLLVWKRQRFDASLKVRVGLLESNDYGSLNSQQDYFQATMFLIDLLLDDRFCADGIEITLTQNVCRGVALRNDHQLFVLARQRGFHGSNREWLIHR